jgi:hypothetical protein
MFKPLLVAFGLTHLLLGADKLIEPGFSTSDEVEITASVLTEKSDLQQALGLDLPKGVVAVKVRLKVKGEKPIRIDRDDFVLLKSDDGQRSTPFAPTQLAGTGGLTLQSRQIGGWAAQGNGPVWGGVGGAPRQGPASGGTFGSQTAQAEGVEAKVKEGKEADAKGKEDPLLAVLKAKELPAKSTNESVEGLLYFPLDGKIKLKNLSLFYKAPTSRLELRFAR